MSRKHRQPIRAKYEEGSPFIRVHAYGTMAYSRRGRRVMSSAALAIVANALSEQRRGVSHVISKVQCGPPWSRSR
jgi:hypothetical protein